MFCPLKSTNRLIGRNIGATWSPLHDAHMVKLQVMQVLLVCAVYILCANVNP
jgi:hypothetical protein